MLGSRFSAWAMARTVVIISLILFVIATPLQSVHAAATWVVDRGDDPSPSTPDLTCNLAVANDCTLRSALEHAGADDSITFSGDYTIQLSARLPDVSQVGLVINGASHLIKIDAHGTGNGLKVTGAGVTLSRLVVYGSGYLWANIWITGNAKNVNLVSMTIGNDQPSLAACSGASKNSHSGVYVDSTASLSGGDYRAWIYGGEISCNGIDPAHLEDPSLPENPGDGIYVNGVGGVRVGYLEPGSPWTHYIASNKHNGITLTGSGGHIIANTLLVDNRNSGLFISGSSNNQVYSSTIQSNLNTGIELVNGAANNQIGCPTSGGAAYRNRIRMNQREGIYISGSGTLYNRIRCNWIGVDESGALPFGNQLNGVVISNGAHDNLIGGGAVDGNVISGNGAFGIVLDGGAAWNTIQGNRVGTNALGTAAIPNAWSGIAILDSPYNFVGGGTLSLGNLISGNAGSGVHLAGALTRENSISSNIIGLNAAGTGAVPNQSAGISLAAAGPYNSIGSGDPASPQWIAGNLREGVYIESTHQSFINNGNVVGLPGLGNGREGVLLVDSAQNNINIDAIRDNGRAGIALEGPTSTQNFIQFGANYGNGGLPLDLGNDGPTPNDPADGTHGPNLLLHYPIITSVTAGVIQGTTCASCGVRVYHAVGNPSAPNGGGTYLSSFLADASGNWSGTVPVNETVTSVTALGYDNSSPLNTSELSPRPQLFLPAVIK